MRKIYKEAAIEVAIYVFVMALIVSIFGLSMPSSGAGVLSNEELRIPNYANVYCAITDCYVATGMTTDGQWVWDMVEAYPAFRR